VSGSESNSCSIALTSASHPLDRPLRFRYAEIIQKLLNALRQQASIGDLEALRVVADTQRHRILCALIAEPMTAATITERLSIPRTRVYYHLDLLQRHGFIAVVDVRIEPIPERVYRAVAASFRVDRKLLGPQEQSLNEARSELLEATADDVRKVPPSDDELLVQRAFVRLSARRRKQLRAALVALMKEYSKSESDGTEVEITVAVFAYPHHKE